LKSRSFSRLAFSQKLTLLLVLTTSSALFLASVALVTHDVITFRDSMRRDLSMLAEIIAAQASAAVIFQDRTSAEETLAALKAEPHIMNACIYGMDGSILASYAGEQAMTECPPSPGDEGYQVLDDDIILARPIVLDQKNVGTLYLRSGLGPLYARLRVFGGTVAIVMLASILVAVVFSTKLQTVISRPIVDLAETARVISVSQDYSIRATKHSQDELGLLTDAFNQMLARIQEQDMTRRKTQTDLDTRVRERNRQLERLQRRNELILNSAGEGICGLDLEGRTIFANPAAAKMVGWDVGELIGKRQHEILHPLGPDGRPWPPESCPTCAILRSDAASQATDLAFLRRDGSSFPVEYVSTPVVEEGRVVGVVVVFKDITRRKQAEEALKQTAARLELSNTELEQFAFVASHDLQEPLRMVTSYVQLLARRYRDKLDADADKFIGNAVDGATRMHRIINDLLAYSRVSRKGEPFTAVECSTAYEQAISNLQASIEESGATVTRDDLPSVMGDTSQLTQLFQNLIGNAIKFRKEEPPRVHVSAVHDDQRWTLSVKDNGIGIDPQYAERIFVIFQRLHTREAYPGTGIGLALCKTIAERHGGRIWVDSEIGKGATFHFTLPR
jgi:PAS domain S-box-containing protein